MANTESVKYLENVLGYPSSRVGVIESCGSGLLLLDLEQYGGYYCCLNMALKTPNSQIMCINLRYKARELMNEQKTAVYLPSLIKDIAFRALADS